MSAFTHLLAVVLLTSPPEKPLPVVSPEAAARLQPVMQQLAVRWEILDPREVKYVLMRPEHFASDLDMLRRRYHELAGAPFVCDSLRFPDRAAVTDMLSFNRAYRQHLDVRQPLELPNWSEMRDVLQETDRLYQIWDTVRDARCEYYYITVRRQALKKLEEMVGPEAYLSGRLPPHVPLWRFQQID